MSNRGRDGAIAMRQDTVLIVDDEDDVRQIVALLLAEEGLATLEARTVEEAERLVERNDVSVALVDLRLGDRDGLELVRKLTITSDIGVIILSGKGGTVDKVIGIEVGADDYITKPFDGRELVARVKRHLVRLRTLRQRARQNEEFASLTFGSWTIEPASHSVVHENGERADLSDSEFRTLLHLARNRGSVLSRDAIHRFVVGPGERDPLDRRIDVYVSNLRKKLGLTGRDSIRTVHRVGYIVD